MNTICEMQLTDYFKLSSGHIALVGVFNPDLKSLLSKCKALFYIGSKKVRSINILGEDEFVNVNENIQKNRRAVRTSDDIYADLKLAGNQKVRLVFYSD